MAEQTRIHLIRHGEVHNPDGVLYGRLPGFRLSDKGNRQAQAVADALADRDIVAVIASPLQRAQETAAPIAARHNLTVDTDPDLIESANFFEGKRVGPGDGAWRDPRFWWQLRNPFTPSWGEPYKQIAARMTTAIDKARARAAGHEAVCVSHQLPVWTGRLSLTGKRLWHDPRRRECAVGSVTSLVYDGDRLAGLLSLALTEAGVPHQIPRAGNMLSVFFGDAPVTDFASARASETWRFAPFFHALLDGGVYPPCSAFEAWFVSAALDDAAFARIADALPLAAQRAAQATVKETKP